MSNFHANQHEYCGCDLHEHECRRCGSTIYCTREQRDRDLECGWEGDNVGCLNEQGEYAAEAKEKEEKIRLRSRIPELQSLADVMMIEVFGGF